MDIVCYSFFFIIKTGLLTEMTGIVIERDLGEEIDQADSLVVEEEVSGTEVP